MSIEALPGALKAPIRIAYLMCRIVDTIEDDRHVVGAARQALFDAFDAVLNERREVREFEALALALDIGETLPEKTLCRNAGRVFRPFRALAVERQAMMRPHILEMSRGLRHFSRQADEQGCLRLQDLPELERYCNYAAGTVGRMLTELFEAECPPLDPLVAEHIRARAEAFGLGLQLVNIVTDIAEDYARGRCFLPLSIAERHGLRVDELFREPSRLQALAVVSVLCRRAREHLKRAREYTLLWPAESGLHVRFFCAVPLTLALATLAEVESGESAVRLDCAPKVSRQCVSRVLSEASAAVASDIALLGLFERWGHPQHLGGKHELDHAEDPLR